MISKLCKYQLCAHANEMYVCLRAQCACGTCLPRVIPGLKRILNTPSIGRESSRATASTTRMNAKMIIIDWCYIVDRHCPQGWEIKK